jgi:hypothetical protein
VADGIDSRPIVVVYDSASKFQKREKNLKKNYRKDEDMHNKKVKASVKKEKKVKAYQERKSEG